MKCFLPCFAASKRRRKHSRSANTHQTHVAEGALEPAIQLTKQKTDVEEAIDYIAESKIAIEEQSIKGAEAEITSTKELAKNIEGSQGTKEEHEKASSEEKKDSDEGDDEFSKGLAQEESSGSLFSLSFESRKQVSAATNMEIEVDSPMQLPRVIHTIKEAHEASGSVMNPLGNDSQGKPSEKEAEEENTMLLDEQPIMRKVKSSAEELINKLEENNEDKGKATGSNHHVSNYRYQDCSDDGYEDVNMEEQAQEESSESLFSLSTDSIRRFSSTEKAENEVNSIIPADVSVPITNEETQGRILDDSSVLNPIENLAQGSVIKATVLQPPNDDKENINSVVQDVDIPTTPEPNLKLSNRNARQRKINDKKKEVGVDTSLSNWLADSETTPVSMNSTNSVGEQTPNGGRGSPWSREDRPILGALTVEEIKKFSVSASSRRTRSPSPDDTPIIGTVGSYWSHTGQSKNSKSNNSGKDAKLKWSSPRVKTRLDRAFEASVAEN
ncbi:chitin biosynthesis protein CHS5-like [Lotus japonicus]|uniref:chitin biosynthesis protein CHS5-like n=1 Tax=Lotus japonicus TaxID=34305 RepID=UPI00258BA967|nr:chitin biosynthesis protein CHS5-like [Lotus japonicus]